MNGVYRGGGFNMMSLNLRDGVRAGVYKWNSASNNRGFRLVYIGAGLPRQQ